MAEKSTSPDHFRGWLWKWTNYVKGYQKRWFVLSSGLLSYYKIPPGTEVGFTSALSYQATSRDLFLCDYPKCGVTWLQNIVWRMLHNGEGFPGIIRDSISFLDFDGKELTERRDCGGKYHVIKTHFPYSWIPNHSDAKYICILRNPKDVCVSLYYHVKGFPAYDFKDAGFDDFFECFLNGETDACDYFAMQREWYEVRNKQNVLLLVYEDLVRDIRKSIMDVAHFLGDEYIRELTSNDGFLMAKIIRETSFDAMQKEDKWTSNSRIGNLPFIRKGIVGDWKNHMNEEQVRLMDRKLYETSGDNGYQKLWSDM